MQLLTHVPLFSIVLPSNALKFFMILVQVGNFSIIDVTEFERKLFSFREDDNSHTLNFELMGYESRNSILNMGNTFLVFLFAVIMVPVVFFLSRVFLGCDCCRDSQR